jgi:hypothetical protein
MSLFKVTGIQTVENKEVFAFAEKVLNADKRISLHIEGAYISGTFRGKSNNEYEYCYTSKSFDVESDAYEVEDAFNKIALEMETVEEVVEETNSINSVLLIEEIQSLQRKSEITDEQAFAFERRSDDLISKKNPFFYDGLKITSLQVSHGLTIGHYFSKKKNFWQTIIIKKLG